MSTKIRTYSELLQLNTIEERFEYLALRGGVGDSTFGFDRYINQQFYRSTQWKQMRQHIIARDLGRDLAVEGYEIHGVIVIHHMNPMEPHEIIEGDTSILDPQFLISTTHQTHNAIHYGNANLLRRPVVERRPGDTKLW
jgi:hypothetical protein